MRKATLFALMIMGAALLALVPDATNGQYGKGGGGKGYGGGGFGGKGGGLNASQDPDVLFDMFARGRSYIVVDDTRMSRSINGPLTIYAQENGLTNAQITRQQFRDFFSAALKAAGPPSQTPGYGMPGSYGPGGGYGPGAFGKKKGPGGDQAGSLDPDTINQLADMEFKRSDRNGDGRLNNEEMPPSLRVNLEKWDKNGDGLIDMNEYRAYYLARSQGSEDASYKGAKGIAAIIIDEEDLDRKPVVFRVGGKQPPGLPDWFNKLDTDKDGQVALYEWRMANKSMDEFKTWDLNDDGFITAEEASKVQIAFAKDNPSKGREGDSLASSGYQSEGGNGGERPSWKQGGGNKGEGGGGNPFANFMKGKDGFGKGKDSKGKDGKGGGKDKRTPGGGN